MATSIETNRRHVYGIGLVCTICGKPNCEHPAQPPKMEVFLAATGHCMTICQNRNGTTEFLKTYAARPEMRDRIRNWLKRHNARLTNPELCTWTHDLG